MALPRLLIVMGSGETSPTMTKTHRAVFERLEKAGAGAAGVSPGAAGPYVLLDTPVGFQENADDISARAVHYFDESLHRAVTVASLRRADDDPLVIETAMARVREAAWVFTGPGSPTYAVRQWNATSLPDLLREKLRPGGTGGAVVLSSAAACTAGVRTVPVYEIYKVGIDPYWEQGLDLLRETGLTGVVIPHFDNAEGGNHDTRFCYLGERRLLSLEAELPDDVLVLGLDEHTAAVFDLDDGTVTVTGNGSMTVRHQGAMRTFPAGVTIATAELARVSGEGERCGQETDGPGGHVRSGSGAGSGGPAPTPPSGGETAASGGSARDPLAVEVEEASQAFDAAVAASNAPGAVRAALSLDASLRTWARDTTNTAERFAATERGAAALRTMVVRLGELAEVGTRDPREVVGPFVDALLGLRQSARAEKRWADSDAIRDALLAAGVEIRDTGNDTAWLLAGQ